MFFNRTGNFEYILPTAETENQIECVMVLFLSVSQDRTLLLKIDSTLFDENHFSNVTKPNFFSLSFFIYLFIFRIRNWMYTFILERFLAAKRDFQFTDWKMFKPGRIIMVFQPVFLNIHATEFVSETDLKQTFWRYLILF